MQPADTSIGYSAVNRHPGGQISMGALIPAVLTMLVVQIFRADVHQNLPLMFGEVIFFMLLSGGLFWVAVRWMVAPSSPDDDSDFRNNKRLEYFTQAGALLIIGLAVISQLVSRSLGWGGDATEIVTLVALQYASFFFAVMAAVASYEKLSLVLNAALVFFVCCMADRTDIFVLGAGFAVVALWWLLGIYWSRLDSKAIDAQSQMLPVHGSSVAITILVLGMVGGIACLVPVSAGVNLNWGLSPFSGGEDGFSDEFARAGIGDGDMITAGANATTTGAVDSDHFIEDDKPSIYDMVSESFGEPKIRKRHNRAIPLEAQAKHLHQVKQSEVAGRTFRTMRDATTTTELDNRESEALFFVEGSVPARFRLQSFQHFDGWDWTVRPVGQSRPLPARVTLKRQFGKPVFSLAQVCSDYLTGSRFHRVKMMRLKSAALPEPAFLNAWHIPLVDDPKFFSRNDDGQIEYAGHAIPGQTVIDMDSFVPNYHLMRQLGDLKRSLSSLNWWGGTGGSPPARTAKQTEPDSIYLQLPDSDVRSQIEKRVARWTEGLEPGWNQVEAIVSRIKTDFELNPNWETDQTAEDTVGHFFENQGGPTYMFATACAMALRSAGYKTRLSQGFVIGQDDYDRVARQSLVNQNNAHYWPEVCLDGRMWIPVEPTPGYPEPYSTQTAWQWLTAQVAYVIHWMIGHPVISLTSLLAVVLTIIYRAELLTWGLLGWWHLVRIAYPTGLLAATRQLIDARCRLGGKRRPTWKTIRTWYKQIDPGLPDAFFDLWSEKNYSDSFSADRQGTLVASCRETIQSLTLKKIRQAVVSNNKRKNNGD